MKKTHAQAGDRLEVVEVKDLATDDLSGFFKGKFGSSPPLSELRETDSVTSLGVDFLIHTAGTPPGISNEAVYNVRADSNPYVEMSF